jgi:hypothetical protein
LKSLPSNSRQSNQRKSRESLDKKGLKGVSSTLIEPGTSGNSKLGIGKLKPLPAAVEPYRPIKNKFNKDVVSTESVETYDFLFVKYENAYIPNGDEVLYSFVVVKPLQPMSLNECASQLGVKESNITGLTRSQYEIGTFNHPTYINQNKVLLSFRYAEIALLPQQTPGRLDDVPLGYPDFNYNPSPITTQQGMLPQPPYPDFITDQGNTGATAIGIGGTVGFVDNSLKVPFSVRPSSWSWNFGGTGTSPTGSTAQNPVVTYGASGSYTVTLTTANANGSASVTKTNFVIVT